MGANISSGQEGNKSQVIAFHSTQNWKLHFEELKSTNKLMVIDFWASWCGPCRFMEPIINEFAAKFTEVEFVKIDVDELVGVAQEFGIQAMPTFVLLKNGKEVAKVVGDDREELERKIHQHRF